MDVAASVRAIQSVYEAAKAQQNMAALGLVCALFAAYAEASKQEVNRRLALGAERPRTEPELFNLKAEQAAPLVGMSPRWLYDHANELPYARRYGRCWRFSRQAIERLSRSKGVS